MRNRMGSILWGIFFVVIGVGFAGNAFEIWNFTLFFAGWWTLFIIIPCIISMVQSGVKLSNTIGLIIGVMLMLAMQNNVSSETIGKLILPVILVLIGLSILFKRSFAIPARVQKVDIPFKTNGMVEYTSIFSGQKVIFPSDTFEGANITSIFGGIHLDLNNAIIDHATAINATCIFGGIEILVPPNVNIVCSNVPIFGGVSNKATSQQIPGNPTIYIDSVCVFGGVEIK